MSHYCLIYIFLMGEAHHLLLLMSIGLRFALLLIFFAYSPVFFFLMICWNSFKNFIRHI